MAPHASKAQQGAEDQDEPPPPYRTHHQYSDKSDSEDGIDELTIGFLPDPMIYSLEHGCWAAELEVKTQDLARLMRDGFHWSEANIQKEKGRILYDGDLPDPWNKSSFNVARIYHLIDVPRDGAGVQWTAELRVYAREVSLLSAFRPGQISIANIRIALGLNHAGEQVYWYNAIHPENCFNAIYDNRPLEGWWPWPKKRHVSSRGCWPWASAKKQQW